MGSSPAPGVLSNSKSIGDSGPPLTPQMQSLYPGPPGPNMSFTPSGTTPTSQPVPSMPPVSTTPLTTPIRPRYPQQVDALS